MYLRKVLVDHTKNLMIGFGKKYLSAKVGYVIMRVANLSKHSSSQYSPPCVLSAEGKSDSAAVWGIWSGLGTGASVSAWIQITPAFQECLHLGLLR